MARRWTVYLSEEEHKEFEFWKGPKRTRSEWLVRLGKEDIERQKKQLHLLLGDKKDEVKRLTDEFGVEIAKTIIEKKYQVRIPEGFFDDKNKILNSSEKRTTDRYEV